MNFIKNNLANAFTLGNLFSGTVGSVHLVTGNYESAGICLLLCCILDFFDGFVARAMKSNSELGVQLDSLADMVSFGVFPGVVIYKALEPFGNEILGIYLPFELKYLGFLITVFSCLRLAIFNTDDEQAYSFKGLNTPSNAVMIFGFFYVCKVLGEYQFLMNNSVLLVVITLVSSWLLISPIKMIAMKFKSKKPKDNLSKIVLLIGGIVLLLLFQLNAIPLLVIYYIIVSLIFQKELK